MLELRRDDLSHANSRAPLALHLDLAAPPEVCCRHGEPPVILEDEP